MNGKQTQTVEEKWEGEVLGKYLWEFWFVPFF